MTCGGTFTSFSAGHWTFHAPSSFTTFRSFVSYEAPTAVAYFSSVRTVASFSDSCKTRVLTESSCEYVRRLPLRPVRSRANPPWSTLLEGATYEYAPCQSCALAFSNIDCTAPSGVDARAVLLPCTVPTAIRSMVRPAKIIVSKRPITVPPGVKVLRWLPAGTQWFQACAACLGTSVSGAAPGCYFRWEEFPRAALPWLWAACRKGFCVPEEFHL